MAVWTVLCDFDGTISTSDATDALLEAFGKPGWREIEAEWLAGRIGSRECMQRQIACLDASRQELDAVIDEIGVDDAFGAFAEAVLARGWDLSIVSDGLDYAIRRILRRYRLPEFAVFANRLTQTGLRTWQLDSPYADTSCGPASGMCKCAFVRRAHAKGRQVLMIGDGRSDFCVAGSADLVLAKGRLIAYCFENLLRHIPVSGFDDALRMLPALAESESVLSV